MIAIFWVYIYGYQFDVSFFSFENHLALAFPKKSHICALKLTDLWITRLLFDLNDKFINDSFAFSPG